MPLWAALALAAVVVGFSVPFLAPLIKEWAREAARPKNLSGQTLGETAEDLLSIDHFFAESDAVEWVALRADPKTVVSAWADLFEITSHRKNVAAKRLDFNHPGNCWLVARASGSGWTHVHFIQGASSLADRHLRELSRRLASDVLLLYGRNDFDKARALACISYRDGKPRKTLLIGEDDDQDLVLDYLELDQDEVGDLDCELDFELGRELAAEFLAGYGLEPRDLGGRFERIDLLTE